MQFSHSRNHFAVWSTTHRNHFHSKMVLAFRYGDDDGDDDERRCWWWDWRFRWWWWWTTVMIQFVSVFGSFCLFCFLWGCRKQLCWDLCTVHKDFLMHHNRSPSYNRCSLYSFALSESICLFYNTNITFIILFFFK